MKKGPVFRAFFFAGSDSPHYSAAISRVTPTPTQAGTA